MMRLITVLAVLISGKILSSAQQISPTLIAARPGEDVTIMCTSAVPGEALNNILSIYRQEQDSFESFETSPEAAGRLSRMNSGSISTYTLGIRSSDNGTILRCTSSGLNSANATIRVIFPPNITRDPASPQDNPLVLREEESVVVNLIISANPQPASFMWTRNGVNVTSGNGLILDGTTFIVDPANRELSGTYMLCVINSAGPGCFEIILDVQYPPQFTAEYVQPESANCTVLDNSRSMFSCAAIMGSRTTFLCDAAGNPMPQFRYNFSGVGDPQVENGNIVIESAVEASAGNYTCTATSLERFPLESAKRQFQFFVGGRPRPLSGVDAMINLDDNEVVLTWTYNDSVNAVPATGFVVTIKLGDQIIETNVVSAVQRSYSLTLSELMIDQMYSAQVAVRNLQGDSVSITEIFTTPSSGSVLVSSSYMWSFLGLLAVLLL